MGPASSLAFPRSKGVPLAHGRLRFPSLTVRLRLRNKQIKRPVLGDFQAVKDAAEANWVGDDLPIIVCFECSHVSRRLEPQSKRSRPSRAAGARPEAARRVMARRPNNERSGGL